MCGVCSNREDIDEVVLRRFITGDPAEEQEANITQLVSYFFPLSLFVLQSRSRSDITPRGCITAYLLIAILTISLFMLLMQTH